MPPNGAPAPELWIIEMSTSAVVREDHVEEVVVTGSRTRERLAQDTPLDDPNPEMRAGPVVNLTFKAAPAYRSAPAPATDIRHDPRSGVMLASFPFGDQSPRARHVALPLKHTAVDAQINGYIATVNVKQEYENPYDAKIEAVYVFPLPEKAGISEFLMVIGDRTIRGILREKEEAQAIYRQARARGHRASLMVQRRPNIFEQKVANIEPGKAIDIDITYFHALAYKDGWYSFVFPTVVGPRYNPPGHPDPVNAVRRGDGGAPGGGTSVEYLRPEERSGHDIGINVRIDAGVEIEELKASHGVETSRDEPHTATVRLNNEATIPNRDFVLDFRVAGQTMKSNLLTYRNVDTREGYFTLMVIPPRESTLVPRRTMEMVFVIDCSGSMSGRPLRQAKEAVSAALDMLEPNDTFQIIRFSDSASQFGVAPALANEVNLAAARGYLAALEADGGTQMINGVKAALDFPHDPTRFRFVTFMTDGYIGNEKDILAAVHTRVGASRIFSFGVGNSVNRFLLDRMAEAGRGAAAYLGLNDSARDAMERFFMRVSHPALTDIEIDWGGTTVTDVYPSALPDLFVGRPLVVTGKFSGKQRKVRVLGSSDGERRTLMTAQDIEGGAGASIAKVWARLRIADLANRQTWAGDPYGELRDAIRDTALRHQLVSNYTSYVAVDSAMRTTGDHGVTVRQAVPVPDGVRYDTTVD